MILRKFAVLAFSLISIVLCLSFAGCQFGQTRRPIRSVENQPIMRVRISDNVAMIPLGIQGPFTIQNRSKQVLANGSSLGDSEVRLEGDLLRVGSQRVPISDYCDIVPTYDGTLAVNCRFYHGSIRIHREQGNQFYVVNHVPVEDYLKGVLPGELPKRFTLEAFKAQAVAARTFGLYEKSMVRGRRNWDVRDNESSQMYVGKSGENDKASAAVEATSGIVLTADMGDGVGWKIFPAFFSSTCGGWTQPSTSLSNIDPAIKPLMGEVRCDACSISPRRNWARKDISLIDVADAMNNRGLSSEPIERITSIRVLARTRHGHILKIEVVDDKGQKIVLSGQKFRLTVGSRLMPSTLCDVRVEGGNVVFYDGHGLGHACGMCQWGAEGMARQGFTAKEILSHYYPGSRLVRAY